MEANYAFTEEEMAVNEHLGYPKAYAKLCRARNREFEFTVLSRRGIDCSKQLEFEDTAVAIVQEKARQARIPHSVVGFPVGSLCEPVPIHLCPLQTPVSGRGLSLSSSLSEGENENEEINPSQSVNGHSFPHHFVESREKLGLAPAAIVVSRRESLSCDSSSILKSLDHNTQLWSHRPAIALRKVKALKENENPHQGRSTFQDIVMARDSLEQEEAEKLQRELQELDHEVTQMKRNNEGEKLTIQDLSPDKAKEASEEVQESCGGPILLSDHAREDDPRFYAPECCLQRTDESESGCSQRSHGEA